MASTTSSDAPTNADLSGRRTSVDLAAAAEAALRRTQRPPGQAPNAKEQFAEERDKRQNFRRLLDPGIVRPNSKEVVTIAMQTLLKLAENLMREPDNPKFQSFKPTNDVIKKRIVEPAGALEYAIAMGFRAEVKDFQPYYVFNPKFTADLRIGAEMLREAVQSDTEKRERLDQAKRGEKAAAEAAKRNVHLAFLDDRKSKEQWDEREKQLRDVRAAVRARQASAPPAESPELPGDLRNMPGSGRRLDGTLVTPPEGPPPYDSATSHSQADGTHRSSQEEELS